MLPEGWHRGLLKDVVVDLVAGVSVNSDNTPCATGEPAVLKTSAVTYGTFDASEHKRVLEGDRARLQTPVLGDSIILSRMNTPNLVGASAYVAESRPDLFLPDRLWRVEPRPHAVHVRWLAYALADASTRRELTERATGTSGSMKNLSKDAVLTLPLLLPPLAEQRRIAEILQAADDAVATAEAVIDQTEKVKRGLVEELLTRGMPGQHSRFKMTEVGELPESWEVVPLGSIAPLQPGFAFKSSDFTTTGIRLLRGTNVGVEVTNWSGEATVCIASARGDEFSRFALQQDDIVIGMDRPFVADGFKVARLTADDVPALLLQRVGRFGRVEGVNHDFVWHMVRSRLVAGHLRRQQKGTDLPHISKSEIDSCLVVLPSRAEQDAIAAVINEADRVLRESHRQRVRCAELQRGLSEELLLGRTRVRT